MKKLYGIGLPKIEPAFTLQNFKPKDFESWGYVSFGTLHLSQIFHRLGFECFSCWLNSEAKGLGYAKRRKAFNKRYLHLLSQLCWRLACERNFGIKQLFVILFLRILTSYCSRSRKRKQTSTLSHVSRIYPRGSSWPVSRWMPVYSAHNFATRYVT